MTIRRCLGEPDCTPSTSRSGWSHHALCPSAGCAACQGFGYLDDEDETECPACAGRGVSGQVGVDDVCDDPLCCVSTPADVVTASRGDTGPGASETGNSAQRGPTGHPMTDLLIEHGLVTGDPDA